MSLPTDQLVSQFCDFAGLGPGGRDKAIAFLRGNNNNIEQAIGAYYDNPNPSRYESQLNYDESQFASDRAGTLQGSQSQPFQLDDDVSSLQPEFGPLTAPSRPPSRQQYGPANAPEYDTAKSSFGNATKEEFEGENEAIRLSLVDQQTGVINSSGQEVVPDVDANDRRRPEGEPAFLKHMLKQDFLPALITTLHSIPKLHNSLLRTNSLLTDYGHNSQWWSGESIQAPVVSYVDDNTLTDNTRDYSSCPPIVAEMQRLIAFLDKTQRSYGSAEPVSRVHAIAILEQTAAGYRSLLNRFLEAWDSVDSAQQLFRSTVCDNDGIAQDLYMYAFPNGIPNAGKEPTLTGLLDNLIWEKKPNGDFEAEHFLDCVAPVQILTIPPHSTWKLQVPTSLYLDRYLLSNKPVIEEMREKNAQYVQQVDRVDAALKKLQSYQYSPSSSSTLSPQKEGDAIKLMEDSIKYLTERAKISDDEGASVHEDVASQKTLKKLQAILNRVQEQITALNEEKEKAQEAMKDFSRVLTIPSSSEEPAGPELTHPYVLRGVATASLRLLITYAQYPASTGTGFNQSNLQWWKMVYDTSKHNPRVEKARVTEEEVLSKAAEGVDDTMLVFVAKDQLGGPPPIPPPPQLESFVERDNAAFRDELAHAGQMTGGYGPAVPVTITGMRTQSESGRSNDSMKVERDDEPIEMEEQDRPPEYDGPEGPFEDVEMGSQPGPEMEERGGQERPGLFGMRRGESRAPGDVDMEGPRGGD